MRVKNIRFKRVILECNWWFINVIKIKQTFNVKMKKKLKIISVRMKLYSMSGISNYKNINNKT